MMLILLFFVIVWLDSIVCSLGANNESQSAISTSASGNKKDTLSKNVITLKWCTPKNSSNNGK